ncbi:MAG: GGDEF domain-containing protein [Nitrospirae bacterium]|nr:GGDEF domain-containing protein [Nitrospirota bacterium]
MKSYFKKAGNVLYNQSKIKSIFLGCAFLALIGVVEYITGYEVNVSFLYLLPISIFCWNINLQAGIFISILCSATSVFSNHMSGLMYSNTPILLWNIVSMAIFFVIFAYAITIAKDIYHDEKSLARQDALTGIANRNAFIEMGGLELERCKRYEHPITVAYIDCDNFKTINDTLGHQTGDMLLQVVADTLKNNVRTSDIVSRIGGDEFAVIMPETEEVPSGIAFKKIQNALLHNMLKNKWDVTFSIGIATFESPPKSLDELISKADTLMYDVKKNGKNMIRHETFETEDRILKLF